MTSGRGRLPAAARARLGRFSEGASHTSFLSVPSAAALRAVGIEAVGDAMGCATGQISHAYVSLCGYGTSRREAVRLGGSGRSVGAARSWGAPPTGYQQQLRDLYARALARLRAEAAAMHADGVVGITITLEQHEALHEVVAVGTAVRVHSRTRPAQVFTADLGGPDVAKLMLRGWAPVSLHVAVQVGVRHDDVVTVGQAANRLSNRGNVEVTAYAQLLQRTTEGVRATLRAAVKGAGAEGCLLSSLRTGTWHTECRQSLASSDHVARVVATGTSVVRFAHPRTPPATPTLRMLPVGGRSSDACGASQGHGAFGGPNGVRA